MVNKTTANVKDFVKEQDVQIFAIGIVGDWNSQLGPGAPGRAAIDDLVSLTGGELDPALLVPPPDPPPLAGNEATSSSSGESSRR